MFGVNWYEVLIWTSVVIVFVVPFIDRILRRRMRMRIK